MKIELLRLREPFEDVFVQTVGRGLAAVLGHGVSVSWQPVGRRTLPTSWICNDRLNAIYRLDAAAPVRNAVRRHYGRHADRRRELMARGYVALATRPKLERGFASSRLLIEPVGGAAPMWLFRGGGRQIRWFDLANRKVWAFAKPGHDLARQQREYEIRSRLPSDIPRPLMGPVDEAANGYWEEFVAGVPLDQVRKRQRRARAFDQVVSACNRLLTIGARATATREYTEGMVHEIEGHLAGQQASRMSGYREVVAPLRTLIAEQGDDLVALGMSHGDVQGDNVICSGAAISLTDWEFAGQRQASYSFIDAAVGGHNMNGIGSRLARWVVTTSSATATNELATSWRRIGLPDVVSVARRTDRASSASVYLLEKLTTVSMTATSPHLHRVGDELALLIEEIREYLRRMGAKRT